MTSVLAKRGTENNTIWTKTKTKNKNKNKNQIGIERNDYDTTSLLSTSRKVSLLQRYQNEPE